MAGAADGTAGTAMLGGGGAALLLPAPLGSLIELLRPPTLPGPLGMPLTPASCAAHATGAVKPPRTARAKNADLPNIEPLRPEMITGPPPGRYHLRTEWFDVRQ